MKKEACANFDEMARQVRLEYAGAMYQVMARGDRGEENETNIVVWKKGDRLMVVTLKEGGEIEWNMTPPDGSEVFDWNGDGLVDERLVITDAGQDRQIRIGEKFNPGAI